jgi:hypothetical protein
VVHYEWPFLYVLRDDRREGTGVLFNGRHTWRARPEAWALIRDAITRVAPVEQRPPKRYGPFKPIAKALPG